MICRGEVYGKRDLAPSFVNTDKGGRSNGPRGKKGGFRDKKNNR